MKKERECLSCESFIVVHSVHVAFYSILQKPFLSREKESVRIIFKAFPEYDVRRTALGMRIECFRKQYVGNMNANKCIETSNPVLRRNCRFPKSK